MQRFELKMQGTMIAQPLIQLWGDAGLRVRALLNWNKPVLICSDNIFGLKEEKFPTAKKLKWSALLLFLTLKVDLS